jgi:leucyl aminopeptidase
MILRNSILAVLLAAGAFDAFAQTRAPGGRDLDASVFIVTSQATYQALGTTARNAVPHRDSVGTPLVVAEVKEYQLGQIAEHVHEKEQRCGGYFAFATRAEADAFVRADRTAAITHPLLVTAYTIDNQATVNPWLPAASAANIGATITQLSSYRNRYYTSTDGKTSAEWIRSTWAGLAGSRSDVTAELYTGCTNCSIQPSVILTVRGTDLPNEVVVLGAHLDSINSSGGGSTTQTAPGADDDASGVATLTEVIRIALAGNWKPRRTVKFMAYAAEEVGLRGSNAIAQSFKAAGTNVAGVLQMDMTNYKSGNVEDMQLVTDFSNESMKTFLVNLFDEYLAPLGITRGTYTCGYGCSDHASWTSAGFPSAMMFEAGTATGYNPYIHSANDTLANMGNSAQNSVKFAQLGLAFLGELGKTGGGTPPVNTPPVANFAVATNGLTATFTDSSTDSDGTIASRAWNFGDGGTSTATNPSRTYAVAGTYTVALTVTDNLGATNTKSSAVTVSTSGGNVLSNGVPVTGLSAAANVDKVYTLVVPAGATNLKFTTTGGTGDADLYAKFGSAPTLTVNDCKSEGSTSAETCTIATAQAGTYYVMVHAYAAYSGVSLTGSFTPPGPDGVQTYTNPNDVTISDNATVNSPIVVSGRTGNAPSNASVTVAIVHTYIGDLKVDLVAPDGTLYNIHNRTGGTTDNINKTVTLNLSSEALNGTWNLRVNDNGPGDVGKIDSWSIRF